MGSNVIIGIVIAIIVIAAVLYGYGYFTRKKNQETLAEFEKRKAALLDLPVVDEIDDVRRMHLVGQSQNTFREWSQRWTDISTRSIAQLDGHVLEAAKTNENFRFFKAKAAIAEAEMTMNVMEQEVRNIREGLKELRESEERNSLEVQQALDVYEELKQKLRENGEAFGPTYSEIQKQLKSVEGEFTQFVTLNTSGDPIEAREVLDVAAKHTYETEELMDRIPKLFEELNDIFPAQLQEITDGYKQMIEDDYVFPEEDFQADIQRVAERVENSLEDLTKVEIAEVEAANRDTAKEIDDLYSVLEREIEAKRYVLKNQSVIADFIGHAENNNRQLMIEIDHTSQSYALNHNELGRVRGFQTEVEEIARRNEHFSSQADQHELPYSEVQNFYKDAFKILEDVENHQVEIDNSLHELRKDEKVAQDKVDEFEFKLRNLKRFVEKHRLPGLPEDYLEFFFVSTERIEELAKALNKIRVDMDEVNNLVGACEEDLEALENQTNDLIDAAGLTEQMMQYANRYRHSHPEIKASVERTLELFAKDYRYKDALDEIGTTLERVEPGVFKRIEDLYFSNRELA